MQVSEERLEGVDRELQALGKSDDQVREILARFEGGERPGLEAVDEELEALAADAAGVEALLAAARARVPSALVESPAAEPFEEEIAIEVEAPPTETMERVSADQGRALPPYDEPTTEDQGQPEPEPEPEPELEPLDRSATQVHARPPAEAAAVRPVLDEADLFGDADDEDAGGSNIADLFGDEPLEAGADPLDALDDPSDEEHDLYDDEEPDHTSVFTVDEVRAIERDSLPPVAAVALLDDDDLVMSSPGPRDAAPPPKDQIDADLDAMLGESIRAGSAAIAEEAAEVVEDDFELLVDDDILVVDDPMEAAPPTDTVSALPPPPPASAAPPAVPKPEEEEDGDAPKKGFFKKLFGGD
jgi:hypothetical protein